MSLRDKHFSHTEERGWGNNFHTLIFYVGGGGGYDDVDKEIDVSEASFLVSEANIFVSEVSKLTTGA